MDRIETNEIVEDLGIVTVETQGSGGIHPDSDHTKTLVMGISND